MNKFSRLTVKILGFIAEFTFAIYSSPISGIYFHSLFNGGIISRKLFSLYNRKGKFLSDTYIKRTTAINAASGVNVEKYIIIVLD